jgi:hypothetical protein
MRVFNLLMIVAVSLILVSMVYQLFPQNIEGQEEEFIKKINEAYLRPGESICDDFFLSKDNSFNNLGLINNEALKNNFPGMYVFFRTNSNNIVINNFFDERDKDYKNLVKTSNNIENQKYSVICYPSVMYFKEDLLSSENIILLNKYNIFCEIMLGQCIERKLKLTPNFRLESQEDVGNINRTFKVEGSTGDEILKTYIFKIDNTKEINETSLEQLYFSKPGNFDLINIIENQVSSNINFNLEMNDAGKYLLFHILGEENSFDYPGDKEIKIHTSASFVMETIDVQATELSVNRGCKVTNEIDSYYNYDAGKCVVRYGCEGCMLDYLCEDAWENETGLEFYKSTNEIAWTYEDRACGVSE